MRPLSIFSHVGPLCTASSLYCPDTLAPTRTDSHALWLVSAMLCPADERSSSLGCVAPRGRNSLITVDSAPSPSPASSTSNEAVLSPVSSPLRSPAWVCTGPGDAKAKLIQPPHPQGARAPASRSNNEIARRKLWIVAGLSVLFIAGEVTGGLIANSLAILTDAAHLLSDLASFLISLAALYLSSRSPTSQLSYGFHRAEILGALISVLIIWLITGILVYEAVLRIISPQDVDGKIMFIVAISGLGVNVLMGLVLLQSGHGHSHGLSGGSGHGHSHGGHAHDDNADHDEGHHDAAPDDIRAEDQQPLPQDHEMTPTAGQAGVRVHSHGHPGHVEHGDHHDDHHHNHGTGNAAGDHKQDVGFTDRHVHHHQAVPAVTEQRAAAAAGPSQPLYHDHDQPTTSTVSGSSRGDGGLVGVSAAQEEDLPRGQRTETPAVEQNINVRAAFIHVLGDGVQSCGVVIAAILIWVNPAWHIADPICTFLFSLLVLFTTTRLFKQIMGVLMEGVPQGIDPVDVEKSLQQVSGVAEVHDLHIWSLSVGKPCLSVHLLLLDDESHSALKEAHTVLARRHNIYHSTIQVESDRNGMDCSSQQ